MRIAEGQKDKLRKEFESNCDSITNRLTFTDLGRLKKAYEATKGTTIKMSRRQLTYNMKIEGGFLPMLAGLIPFLTGNVLPALRVGELSGLASFKDKKIAY